MSFFLQVFWILSVVCIILYFITRAALPTVSDANFAFFQRSYLTVYLLAMAGDWLQGPHVYVLYDSYGMTPHQIEILFVAGFGSSMMIGTIVGSFADRYGRRANCILYGILYSLACVTKHFANFWVLMLGRVLGGMATSILYSAFESWLIYEHHKRGFESDLLGNIFSHAVLGNSLVAIVAGLLAQKVADVFGFVAPFDVSILLLCIMVVMIIFTWTENYGDKSSSFRHSFSSAFQAIRNDHKILCLGIIQSLFEGSMYVFVLEWTPALTPSMPEEEQANKDGISQEGHRGTIPHGHIFAAFMVAIMIGSSLFKLLSKYTSVESFMRTVLFVSSIALATPIFFAGNQLIVFAGFLVFETCVGIFWPSLSTMRGKYVPEETRATTMNLFRIPLNLIVIFILLQSLPMKIIFQCCTFFLLAASFVQHWLYTYISQGASHSPQVFHL
ncbi:molybdate-anion transporter-like isoform X2 [Pomacea canaliculata]|uniref:molybdate-anion transporter-like isoform X2 n=1 Tax=Pomacea canaliculata TaxID=400727 RepID=UPI000D73BFA6|nr:molybdate-anion transporter-like isoform X2 [Pomacea canaliculata]